MSVHTHLRPGCHLWSKPSFLSTPHPSTPFLFLFLLSHTLYAAAVSVLYFFYFFAPFMIGHICLSDDRPRVVLGDVALRKRRDHPVLFFSSNRCVFETSWEEDGLWGVIGTDIMSMSI